MFSSYKLVEFGKKLRLIRKNVGLTQTAINKLTGLSEETLRRLENGKVIPKYETLETLSHVYKFDLLELLVPSRKSISILDFYTDLDKIIMSSDVNLASKAIDSLKNLKLDASTSSLINHNEFILIESFSRCAIHYYDNKYTEFDKLITTLTDSLKLSNNKFSLSNLECHTYNPLEIRVLLLIGLILARKNEIKTSTDIIVFCLEYMIENSNQAIESIEIISKLHYNLAYNYHKLDFHSEALIYSDLGIKHAITNNSMYCLPYLYARKSIAEFKLNDDNYTRSLKKAIGLLLILEDKETAESIQKTAENVYGIKLGSIDLE